MLCSQPWPEDGGAPLLSGGGSGGRPPLNQHRRQASNEQLQRSSSNPMSGMTFSPAQNQDLQQHQQQQQDQQQQQQFQQQQQHGAGRMGAQPVPSPQRRSQSMASFQAAGPIPMATQRPLGWHPASMPERAGLLGSSGDDPRWGAIAATGMPGSAPDPAHSLLQRAVSGHLAGSAPGFSPLELRNMVGEESLGLLESQSHLLDSESRALLAKQRQYLEWAGGSAEEAGPMASALDRQDSAGSGNELAELGDLRRMLRAASSERDAATAHAHELRSALAEKKRQLFGAIQERETLRERVRALEGALGEYRDVTHCKICLKVGGGGGRGLRRVGSGGPVGPGGWPALQPVLLPAASSRCCRTPCSGADGQACSPPPPAGPAQLRGAALPALPLLRHLLQAALHRHAHLPRMQQLRHGCARGGGRLARPPPRRLGSASILLSEPPTPPAPRSAPQASKP